ncbi:unnamed protein product, partial [Meganyctiphanes norvegica]
MLGHTVTIKLLLLTLAYTATYALQKNIHESPVPLVNGVVSHELFREELLEGSKDLAPTLPKKCPNATSISPCVCTHGNIILTIIDLDCSQVADEVELETIFKEDFPNRHFRMFNMSHSPLKILPKSVFGNHLVDQFRFEIVDFSHSALEEVEKDAFQHSNKLLSVVDMTGAKLNTFPFESIEEFQVLSQMLVHENQYSEIPPLVSSSLRDLTVGSSSLTQLPEFSVGSLPSLQILGVQHSPLDTITPGQFVNLESLQWLVLHDVGLTTLETDTFLLNDNLLGRNITFFIHIEDNSIQEIQPDAIYSTGDTWVFLRGNSLSILDKDVWQSLLDNGVIVDVYG